MITDLIGETKATKEAIDSAIEGVHEAEKMNEQPQMNVPPPSYEADLFGGFDSPAPAPAVDNTPHPMAVHAPPQSTESVPEEEASTQASSHAPPHSYEPVPAPSGAVETVMSSDDEGGAAVAPPPPAAPATDEPMSMFSNASPAVHHKTYDDPHPGIASSPSAAEVEDIKVQAQQAEQRAQEAEASRRSLAEQADDLRQVAEQAENELREKESHAGHKRNPLRVGGKRKEMVRRRKYGGCNCDMRK